MSPHAPVLMPGDAGWDTARQAWNRAVDQHPAAVALPACPQDVADIIAFARANGLRVAAQGTGHNAAALGSLAGTVLVKTGAMRRVLVDPVAKIARVEAGALSRDVVLAAAEHGLTALLGSSPDVGVVGYTIGGGISWLGRAYGLAANNVTAVELVTADGQFIRADASTQTDLFWALRGGGGSFGVVTAIELRLFPVTEVYAGQLWWPASQAAAVVPAWGELTSGGLPDEFASAIRLMNFPPVPSVPEHLRGQSFVILFACHLGRPAEADALVAPLRSLRPATDTLQTIAASTLSQLHMDPPGPTPTISDGLLLASLPGPAAGAFVRAAPSTAGRRLTWAELLHIGGEMRRSRPSNGALAAIDARYQLSVGGRVPGPPAAPEMMRSVAAMQSAMRPWAARQMYLNIAGSSRDLATFWPPGAYDRLRRIKAAIDPDDLIRSNHPVPGPPGTLEPADAEYLV